MLYVILAEGISLVEWLIDRQQLKNDSTLTGLDGVEDMLERSHERDDGVHYCNYADWISHEVDEKSDSLWLRLSNLFPVASEGSVHGVMAVWPGLLASLSAAYGCTASFACNVQPKQFK